MKKKNVIVGVIFASIYWISGYVTGVCRMQIKETEKELEKIRNQKEEINKKMEFFSKLHPEGLKD